MLARMGWASRRMLRRGLHTVQNRDMAARFYSGRVTQSKSEAGYGFRPFLRMRWVAGRRFRPLIFTHAVVLRRRRLVRRENVDIFGPYLEHIGIARNPNPPYFGGKEAYQPRTPR